MQDLVLIDEFLNDIKKKCSPNTYLAYKQDLFAYKEFVLNSDQNNIQEFSLCMKEKGLSPRTQNRMMSSLKSYFKFLKRHNKDLPEGEFPRPPHIRSDPPPFLRLESFKKLYKACQTSDTLRTASNQITLLMLFDLGLRVSQLIHLNLKDFDAKGQFLKILDPRTLKDQELPLSPLLFKELQSYIAEVRPHFNANKKTEALLLNSRGNRPSRVDIWRWLSAWSKKAGFRETINPQQFRHGCVMALFKAGADVQSVQKLLGHRRIETTRKYKTFAIAQKKPATDLKKVVKAYHPLSQAPGFHPYKRP